MQVMGRRQCRTAEDDDFATAVRSVDWSARCVDWMAAEPVTEGPYPSGKNKLEGSEILIWTL
jgi:hypothetical protein